MTGIIAVDGLPEALSLRRTLTNGESVITRDGIWIGRDWLRVSRDKDVHAGVIGREKEMRELRETISIAEERQGKPCRAKRPRFASACWSWKLAAMSCRAKSTARTARIAN